MNKNVHEHADFPVTKDKLPEFQVNSTALHVQYAPRPLTFVVM